MDVSRLGIVVESKGIDEARKALDGGNGRGGLVGAADKSERAVKKLTDSLKNLLAVNAGGSAAAWAQSMQQLNSSLGAVNGTLRNTVAMLNQLQAVQNVNVGITQRAAAANNSYGASGNVVTNTLKAMATAATVYQGIRLGLSVVKEADAWALMEAKLKNATGSLNNAKVAQGQLFDLSQRLRVPLEETARLYTRLAPSIQKAGKSSEYAKEMVEGISTALQLSGATGGEAASVMLQLSQSFSSGVLNGAEFNAVAENGSVLMRALENYTGKTTSELKKLGSTGQLSMDLVGKAIQASLPKWREQFDSLPMTFEGAMIRLGNAWQKAVGEMGQSTKFNTELSQAVATIEKMIPMVATELGNAFIGVMGWIEKNKTGLADMYEQGKNLVAMGYELAKTFAVITSEVMNAHGESNALAQLFKYLAWGVAAISDGFRVVGSSVAFVGTQIVQFLTLPMRSAMKMVEWIAGGMADLMEGARKGAEAVGLRISEDGKKRNAEVIESLRGIADISKNAREDLNKGFGGMKDAANSWVTAIANGEGALHKMMNANDVLIQQKKELEDSKRIRSYFDAVNKHRGTGGMDEKAWQDNNPAKTSPTIDQKKADAMNTARNAGLELEARMNAALKVQTELRERLEKYGLAYDKMGPNQKQVVEFEERLVALGKERGKNSTEDIKIQQERVNVTNALAIARKAADEEVRVEHLKEFLNVQKAEVDQRETGLKSLRDEVNGLQAKVDAYKQTKGAVEDLALAQAKEQLAAAQMFSNGDESQRVIEQLKEQVALLEKKKELLNIQGSQDAMDAFDKLFDARKAEKFGNVLEEGFGNAGSALGKLLNSMDKYQARQAKIAQGRRELDKMDKSSEGYAKRNNKLIAEETESRIASYADMAGAAKGFFEEGSKGYKVLQAAEMTFRAFQMAMQVESFLRESGFITAITSLFVGSKATETAAEAASVAPHVAAEGAKQSANAITALTSALAAPFPANIAAYAMVAAMLAAIGVAVGGGGGGGASLSQQRQQSQGTGTVFGDSTAKSESISKSLELLSRNSDIALEYSSGMLQSLQSIEQSLTGAVSGVIRSGSSVTGKGYGNSKDPLGGIGGTVGATVLGGVFGLGASLATKLPIIGGLASKLLGGLFGSSSTLKDAGLMGTNQSVANILQSGFSVKGYQDVQTKKKAFGITYSDKTKTNTSAVDPAIGREFSNVIDGMVSSLTDAAKALGLSGEEVKKKLAAVNIDIGKISLKDMSAEEMQKQLEAVFSAIGDKLATVALPSVIQFQKAGEGLLETAVRVATGVETANYELEKLGINAVNYADVIEKNGDVGAEIVRQSLMAVEKGTGIGNIISTLTGSATEMAETYKQLVSVRNGLQSLGIAGDVSRDLIKAAGGLDKLQDSLDAYMSNFFSSSEQQAIKTTALRKEFDKLGVAMPSTKAGFRSLVETLSASGASGQELAVKVIGLAGAFADLSSATDQLISNAQSDLTDAYNTQADSLNDLISKFKDFSESLRDFKSNLLTGDLSTLDVAGKYSVQKADFQSLYAKALTGDETAISKFQDSAQAFLEASRAMNASGVQYTSDFEMVLKAIDAVTAVTDGKSSMAQQQLDALNKQVAGLIEVNTSVLTVAQAIANLQTLLAGGVLGANTSTGPNATIMPVSDMSKATSYSATSAEAKQTDLVNAIADLNTQVTALRQENAQQAELIANVTVASQEAAANRIVQGTQDNVSMSNYSAKVQNQLV